MIKLESVQALFRLSLIIIHRREMRQLNKGAAVTHTFFLRAFRTGQRAYSLGVNAAFWAIRLEERFYVAAYLTSFGKENR